MLCYSYRRAFSLLEVCIVLALLSILFPLLLQSYAAGLRYFEHMRRYNREVQERLWLQHFLTEQSQRAGMTACGGVGLLAGGRAKELSPVRLESHILWFRHANAYQLLDDLPKGSVLHLKKSAAFHVGDSVLISDCEQLELQHIVGHSSHSILLQDKLKNAFRQPVFIAPWETYGLVFEPLSKQRGSQLYLKHRQHQEPLFQVQHIKVVLESPQDKASLLVSVRWPSGLRLHERFYVRHS